MSHRCIVHPTHSATTNSTSIMMAGELRNRGFESAAECAVRFLKDNKGALLRALTRSEIPALTLALAACPKPFNFRTQIRLSTQLTFDRATGAALII